MRAAFTSVVRTGAWTRAVATFYARVCGWDGREALDDPDQPAAWLPVLSVPAPEQLVPRVRDLGGTVARAGGHTLVADPHGATALLAADGRAPGLPYAPMSRVHGAPSWVQLNTPDLAAAAHFWGRLTGTTVGASDNEAFTYRRLVSGSAPQAGVLLIDERSGDLVPAWQTYLHSDDLPLAASRVVPEGGALDVPETRLAAGSFLVARDPAGAVVALDDMCHDEASE